ncbi:hypothetical protein PIB30_054350 [Stylosanthes scabra]|uniref:Uncharacterized protein n=1 Tax=Stylosanthes scabra TaxID=79078 RepID=A0ABU6YI24_9FABA|nr:hypothetical protein [Stylosanthes scabra]
MDRLSDHHTQEENRKAIQTFHHLSGDFKRHKMESGIRIPYLNVCIESKRVERASRSRKRCVNRSTGSKVIED